MKVHVHVHESTCTHRIMKVHLHVHESTCTKSDHESTCTCTRKYITCTNSDHESRPRFQHLMFIMEKIPIQKKTW